MVNPHDTDGIKEAILLAMNAGPKETRDRMARMRRMISTGTVAAPVTDKRSEDRSNESKSG